MRVAVLMLGTFAALTAATGSAHAQGRSMGYGLKPIPGDTGPKEPEGVAFTQNLGESVPTDLEFYDHNNQSVTLASCIGGKPTILVLAYYRCPKLCNQVLTGLLDALKDLRAKDVKFTAGNAFNVVIVSIDPRESSLGLARPKRIEFLKDYLGTSEAPDGPGWLFLTSNHGQGTDVKAADRKVHALATAMGFEYALRAKNRSFAFDTERGEWVGKLDGRVLEQLPKDYDYDHKSGIAVVTPDGKISRYLMGINYAARDIRLGLVEASGGKIGTVSDAISQYCYVYDDVKGHYKPTLKWTAIIAVPVMLGMFAMIFLSVRQARREKPIIVTAAGIRPGTPTVSAAADEGR